MIPTQQEPSLSDETKSATVRAVARAVVVEHNVALDPGQSALITTPKESRNDEAIAAFRDKLLALDAPASTVNMIVAAKLGVRISSVESLRDEGTTTPLLYDLLDAISRTLLGTSE